MGVENFSEQFENVPWSWLRPHYEQGALILVDAALSLPEVARRIANDDTDVIKAWLASSLLAKPSATQVAMWEQNTTQIFDIFVVQPFVLVQFDSPEQLQTEQ